MTAAEPGIKLYQDMKVSRALVVAPQGLGDCLQATPLIKALRDSSAALKVDVIVTRPGPKALFEGLDEIDEVIFLPYWDDGVAGFVKAVLSKRRRRPYDVSFLSYPAARREYHALTWLFPSRRRVAHAYEPASLMNGLWLHTDTVPIRPVHNVERNLDLARQVGVVVKDPITTIVPRAWQSEAARDPMMLAIHPGSIDHDGFALKRWPKEHFLEIGRRFAAEGYRISVIAGPNELDIGEYLTEGIRGATQFRGNLKQLALHLGSVGALVANDTGVAHLAAALRTPVLALFGPTPVECSPYGENVVALRPTTCPPCFTPITGISGCVRDLNFQCLREDLGVDLVQSQLKRVLNSIVCR